MTSHCACSLFAKLGGRRSIDSLCISKCLGCSSLSMGLKTLDELSGEVRNLPLRIKYSWAGCGLVSKGGTCRRDVMRIFGAINGLLR